jgi:phenylacetate-CoA ligase
MTRLDEEREVQKSWRLKRPAAEQAIENLLRREFLKPEAARELETRQLGRILRFARSEVPYYRSHDAWSALALDVPAPREVLTGLPVMSKRDVQDRVEELRAERLPPGEKAVSWTSSSGTTGRPTRVLFSQHALLMFGLLVQRQLRWARIEPQWTQAVIRLARDLPRQADGTTLADGAIRRAPGWMYLRKWFHTGPMIGFNRSNSVEEQIDMLRRERPEYLVTFPGTLETLVYACQGKPVDSLRAFRSISATLTQGMRNRVESATGLHVYEAYGLNEIGIVAHRCEAGRYHVNAEHCLVEIVDAVGKPCNAGETGRILVTSLTNYAMPLVRYDSGDLAEAVEGPCSCGRTLPSIGRIVGRYRAMRHAPEGTSRRVNLIAETIDGLPLEVLAGLREYHLHQFKDDSFELRLVTVGEPEERLVTAVREAWDAENDRSTPLRIRPVDQIDLGPGGKQQEFTSDFFPSVHEGSEINPGPS